MVLTDSHCHLAMAGDQAGSLLTRARSSGLGGFLVPATKLDDLQPAVDLSNLHKDVWAAVGFHPHEAKDFDDAAREKVRLLAREPRVVAIGEIGLDYHYQHSTIEIQRRVLVEQLVIAREAGLPVIIHNRESTVDLLEILGRDEASGIAGVLHSFTESYEVAAQLIDRGFFISFSGILTFKTAGPLREVARRLPPESVLIETDTPFLAPVPFRGKDNEPAFVGKIAETLANLWGKTLEEVARLTTANFERAFGVTIPG